MEISMKQTAGHAGFFDTNELPVDQEPANLVLPKAAVLNQDENDVDNLLVAQFIAGDQVAGAFR